MFRKTLQKWTSPVILGLVLMPLGAGAADPVLLEEITVRGQRQQPLEESLTIREVRESPARDMGEALQDVPGLDFVRKGAIANDIVLRGFQRDNLNVFLDGVRLYGGCPSRMDPPSFHFDFAEVESIEIIKGPYDLRNPGSLGGMVNAVGKSPGEGPSVSANLGYGSFDYLDASLTASYGGKRLDGLGGYAYKSSDVPDAGNGRPLTAVYPETSSNRYRPEEVDGTAYRTHTAWLRSGYRLEDGRSELAYTYQDADHVLYPYLKMDADYDRTHRLNWTTTLTDLGREGSEVQLQAWFNRVDHLMDDTLRASSLPSMMVTRDYMMETDAETWTGGGKLHGEIPLGPGILAGGLDYYRRTWDAVNRSAMWMSYAAQPMIPDVAISNLGGFAEYTWPLAAAWTLKGGVRLDHTTADARDLSPSRLAGLFQPYFPGSGLPTEPDYTEPTANLQLTWQPIASLEVFAGAASASRTPDPQELFIGLQRMAGKNWIGNPGLEPVRNNEVDLGVQWSDERLFASAAVFYSSLEDDIYIADRPDPDGPAGDLIPARTYQNIDATRWGGEFGTQLVLPLDLYLLGNLSWVRAENDATDQPLAEIPPLSGSAALRYDTGTWYVEARERFADRQDRVDRDLNETETAGWAVTDLKAGLDWRNWTLSGGVNNLFDHFYVRHLSYQRDPFASGVKIPETGRFAYLNLAWSY